MKKPARVLMKLSHWTLRWTWRLGMVLCVLVGTVLWSTRNGPVQAPGFVQELLLQKLDREAAALDLAADIDAILLDLREGFVPVVVARGLHFRDEAGTDSLSLDELELVVSRDNLMHGQGRIRSVRASGVRIAYARDAGGQLSLQVGDETVLDAIATPDELLARIRTFLDKPVLRELRFVGVEDVNFTFVDEERAARLESRGGNLRLTLDGARLALDVDLGQVGRSAGRMALQVVSDGPGSGLLARGILRGIVPVDLSGLAGTSPFADLLARFDAPVSVTVAGGTDGHGGIRAANGTIAVGSGSWTPPGGSAPVPLTWMRGKLELSPDKSQLALTDLSVASPHLSLKGSAELRQIADTPDGDTRYAGQVALSDVSFLSETHYGAPQDFDGLWATLSYTGGDGALDVTSLSLQRGELLLEGKGTVAGLGAAPQIALDLKTETITPAQLLAFWPISEGKGGRRWITNNIHRATIQDVAASLRINGTDFPDLGVSFTFRDADVRPARGLPVIHGAVGRASIFDRKFRIIVDHGVVPIEDGPPILLSDGAIEIGPLFTRRGRLSARFEAKSDVSGALAFLASPAFHRNSPDVPKAKPLLQAGEAEGRVQLSTDLEMPITNGTKMKDVSFRIAGDIRGFDTTKIVPEKRLQAERLTLDATPDRFVISGPIRLEGHPLEARFERPLKTIDGVRPAGQVIAEGPLTGELAKSFGLNLPDGAARGAGKVYARVDLPAGAPPRLAVDGDLEGIDLRLSGLGIRKTAGQPGSLQLAGVLGDGGRLESIRFKVPGAELAGSAPLRPGGLGPISLRQMRFGNWLDAAGTITPGQGQLNIALSKGQVDLRRAPKGKGGGPSAALDLTLDSLRITDTLALRNVRGALDRNGHGTLNGSLNGQVPVQVRLSGAERGTRIDVNSANAGRVLGAADIEQGLRGGEFRLRLVPTGAEGSYTGRLRIKDTALLETSALMRVVSALSLVGAVEQVAGGGIGFSDIRADFTMVPGRVDITSGSAVGPSVGMSFDGAVNLANETLDLQGVVTPIYFLNRAGSFMTRRGEGVFGMTYTIKGGFAEPRVAANPLSLLAPGFVREIFRGSNSAPAPQE